MKTNKKLTVLDYKAGYHSYVILTAVLMGNIILNLLFDFQWAETTEIEYLMILLASMSVTMITGIYNQALHQINPLYRFYAYGWSLFGLYFVYQAFIYESHFVVNGLVTISAAILLFGLMFILSSLAYFVRLLVDKKSETQN
ncbi:hypothetical protein ACO1PF_04935 [Alkalibacterium sp. f15]|uniref:hypothetical protein n=1 Tax=Alkalibacterium sp. f15 TaxID=3414029 RepID=UPI003BF86100